MLQVAFKGIIAAPGLEVDLSELKLLCPFGPAGFAESTFDDVSVAWEVLLLFQIG